MLPNHDGNEYNSDNGPDDTENPDINGVVTHTEEVRRPKKYIDAQVKQRVDDLVTGANGCAIHTFVLLGIRICSIDCN